jgi:hypothetical protein
MGRGYRGGSYQRGGIEDVVVRGASVWEGGDRLRITGRLQTLG